MTFIGCVFNIPSPLLFFQQEWSNQLSSLSSCVFVGGNLQLLESSRDEAERKNQDSAGESHLSGICSEQWCTTRDVPRCDLHCLEPNSAAGQISWGRENRRKQQQQFNGISSFCRQCSVQCSVRWERQQCCTVPQSVVAFTLTAQYVSINNSSLALIEH